MSRIFSPPTFHHFCCVYKAFVAMMNCWWVQDSNQSSLQDQHMPSSHWTILSSPNETADWVCGKQSRYYLFSEKWKIALLCWAPIEAGFGQLDLVWLSYCHTSTLSLLFKDRKWHTLRSLDCLYCARRCWMLQGQYLTIPVIKSSQFIPSSISL